MTQYLAGRPALIDRYDKASFAARAVLHAAMDARRLGHGPALPRLLLEQAAAGYLTDEQWDLLTDGWLEQHGTRTRRLICPPAGFWDAAVGHAATTSDHIALDQAAHLRGRRHAFALWQHAADTGDIRALWGLARQWLASGVDGRWGDLLRYGLEADGRIAGPW
ncbi:hypothetical protein [Nonomuraea sp. NPDC049400]|uniref:hypothetical protein n=1 Tax=Nonomuraea sp. NPDC049400 TaxID=3364352 RepID=UPI0037B3D06D